MQPWNNDSVHCVRSDDKSAVVKSYITEDGLWSVSITTDDELYVVEVFLLSELIQHFEIFTVYKISARYMNEMN